MHIEVEPRPSVIEHGSRPDFLFPPSCSPPPLTLSLSKPGLVDLGTSIVFFLAFEHKYNRVEI